MKEKEFKEIVRKVKKSARAYYELYEKSKNEKAKQERVVNAIDDNFKGFDE